MTAAPDTDTDTAPPTGAVVAVLVARGGRLPAGQSEAVVEAGGRAIVVGDDAAEAAGALDAVRAWWAETGPGLRPGALSSALAPVVAGAPLVVLPASPDGRDLAPRLAAAIGHELLAGVVRVEVVTEAGVAAPAAPATPAAPAAPARVRATLARADDRLEVPVEVFGPVVATLSIGARRPVSAPPLRPPSAPIELALAPPDAVTADADVVAIIEPEPATMDLAEAPRVVGGGAGLVPAGTGDGAARATFDRLVAVAAAMGASAGATRVATDAGWTDPGRQIGTTGVTVDPDLYVALGVSGAAQHTGGLGAPRHIVSINTDPSCPMTAMADLGIVTDAPALLDELARRFGVTGTTTPEEQAGG